MKPISKLHFITTSAALAEQACRGGVDWIQLRLKNVSYDDYKREALKTQEVCKKYNATLIINDVPKLALDIQADGVHLGKEDMAPDEARALLGNDFIIGRTANTFQDVLWLSNMMPVNYIGLGPFRFTNTKQNLSPVLGLEGYKNIFALKEKLLDPMPIVGIGGITYADVPELMATGLYGIAVSGAIGNAEDVTASADAFIQAVKQNQ
jgi:thiamine-phosphate pyrophosphorylase